MAGLVACLLMALVGRGMAEEVNPAVARICERFSPTHPTVVIDYRVSYQLMSLEVKRIASARVHVTQGLWSNRCTGVITPACFVDFRLDTPEAAGQEKNSRVVLHNRITSVLTIPDLEALQYVKQSDERFQTFFKHQRVNNIEAYDLDSGKLNYYRHDYLTGQQTNNVPGAEQLARQSREVLRFMKMIFGFYTGRLNAQSPAEDMRVYVFTEGALVPFDLNTDSKRRNVSVMGHTISSLCLKVAPAREANGKGRQFAMFAASFEDVSRQTGADSLINLARQSMEWSMVPLVTEFGLCVGSVRCVLTDIEAIPLSLPVSRTLLAQVRAPMPGDAAQGQN